MTESALELSSPETSHQVLEQAAHWFALLNSGEATEAEQGSWQAWLADADEHRVAWCYVERVSQRFEPIKSSTEQRLAVTAYQQAGRAMLSRRQMMLGLAAFSGSGVLAWATWQQMPLSALAQTWVADYRTSTGEVRQVTLEDGSGVWINALSAFNQDYRTRQRRLHLLKGEILIDTAVDRLQRPFYVQTTHGRLQALGTKFSVRWDDTATQVTVYEGAVQVHAAATNVNAIIAAGQQARFSNTAIDFNDNADPAREAWTRGLLVARNIPLSEVIQTLRLHHYAHLSVAPQVADLLVLGGYPIDDLERTLSMLETVMPIRVQRTLPWWISIEAY